MDVTDWTTNNYSIHIAQYLKKYRQSYNEIWPVKTKQLGKCGGEVGPGTFYKKIKIEDIFGSTA